MGSYRSNTAFSKPCKFLRRNVVPVLEHHMQKGNCVGRKAAEKPSSLTTRGRWTTEATAASTQLTSDSLCMHSILCCSGMMGAITNSYCLLPVSYSGVHFPLGCTACSSLSYKDFGMKHKVSTASQRHDNSRIVCTGNISVLQNFMG